jgi:carbonic anhydrase/acetyltransferase-like protein (isoleucine patch superfamily)
MLHFFKEHFPKIAPNIFIAPGAHVIGRVTIGAGSSVWHNAVIRGDSTEIIVGQDSNIQDNSTLHGDQGVLTIVGDRVTVGHNCVLHSCHIQDGALIGVGAIILNGAVIGEESMIAAGSLIPPDKIIPPRVLAMGSPSKIIRDLTEEELAHIRRSYQIYRDRALLYLASPKQK